MNVSSVTLLLRRLRLPLTPWARKIDRCAWAAAVAFALLVLAPWSHRSFPSDLYQFWVAGQGLKTMRVSNIYSDEDRQAVTHEFKQRASSFRSDPLRATATGLGHLDFTATPLLLATLNAVSSGDFEEDLKWFRAASAVLYGFGILALAFALGYSGVWALMLLVVFTTFFWPFQMNMIFANVSCLQAGAFMIALALLRDASPARHGFIGLLLGYITMCKPTIAPAAILLAVSLAADRRWLQAARYGAGLAVAGLLGLLIPWFAFGDACTWTAWRESVPAVLFTSWWLTGGFLGKLIALRDPLIFAAFCLVLMAGASVVIVQSRNQTRLNRWGQWIRDAGAASLGAAIALLSSPIVHSHYFVVAVPAALIALRPGGPPSVENRWRTAFGFLAVFLMAAHPLIHSLGLTHWPNHSLWTFLGVWIVAALLVEQRRATYNDALLRVKGLHQGRP